MSAQTVLFDLPGPKARRRYTLITIVATVLVVGVVAGMLWLLRNEITPAMWAPFADPVVWTAYILPGLRATALAALVSVITSGLLGVVLGVGRLSQVRALGQTSFGVNVFCPPDASSDSSGLGEYARLLRPLADRYGLEVPEPRRDDDHWSAKIEVLASLHVPVVSFTFGLPDDDAVGALHWSGAFLLASVTSAVDAVAAEAAGVDGLVVQGPDAGGHQATLRIADPPNGLPLPRLLAEVREVTDLPLVAAGGVSSAAQVRELLGLGAAAVQAGTAFMLADEAGTSAAVRDAYADPAFTETVLTRAFSGRWARSLANEFAAEFSAVAPAAYPEVNQLVGPIRGAAMRAGKSQHTHLWAGTGWREARAKPAAEIVRSLVP